MSNQIKNVSANVATGFTIALAAYGIYQLVKLGVDVTKAGIQELKERKALKK